MERRSMVAAALVVLVQVEVLGGGGGAVYKVGDSAGWTTIGNVDYKNWAMPKTFQLGDTIVFEYNPQFHNVMRVTHTEYKSCNASSPMSTHTTGNDSIIIDTRGHHFFICGVPGHCQAGQKVDINVLRAPSVAAGAGAGAGAGPLQSPSPTSTVATPAPTIAPSPSDANPLSALDPLSQLMLLLLLMVYNHF